jgi:hypothetical protein
LRKTGDGSSGSSGGASVREERSHPLIAAATTHTDANLGSIEKKSFNRATFGARASSGIECQQWSVARVSVKERMPTFELAFLMSARRAVVFWQ